MDTTAEKIKQKYNELQALRHELTPYHPPDAAVIFAQSVDIVMGEHLSESIAYLADQLQLQNQNLSHQQPASKNYFN